MFFNNNNTDIPEFAVFFMLSQWWLARDLDKLLKFEKDPFSDMSVEIILAPDASPQLVSPCACALPLDGPHTYYKYFRSCLLIYC